MSTPFITFAQAILVLVGLFAGLYALLAAASSTALSEIALGVYLLVFVVCVAGVAALGALARLVQRLEAPPQP